MWDGLIQAAFLGLLIRIAWKDWRERIISDRSVLLLFAAGGVSLLLPDSIPLQERIGGMFAVSIPLFALSLLLPGAFGGGDIKLMAAGGFFLGGKKIFLSFCLGLLGGSAFALCLLARGRGRKAKFPLGPFLCAGMLAAYDWEALMTQGIAGLLFGARLFFRLKFCPFLL